MSIWKIGRTSPAQVIILGFLALILGGTALLMLPPASRGPGGAPFLDALFTATSATCVTGLVVENTVTYWSTFGQVVILALIQIGGMGVITMAVAVAIFTGRRIGLRQRYIMQESISAPQMGGIIRMTGFILRATVCMEAAGAALLALRFCPELGLWKGLWYAVFHAVSAFCNAGFDLLGDPVPYASLTGYVADPLVNCVIMALIVLGGIGFLTWSDAVTHGIHLWRYRLQSKLILTATAVLLVLPALFFFFYEFSLPQWQDLSGAERFWSACFQSVSPRTAGFNTIDLAALSEPSQLLTTALMLIGGSPGSTAGGFKNTTLVVLLLTMLSVFRRKGSAQAFGRRIPAEVLRSAAAIFMLYLTLFLAGGMLLCCIDGVPLQAALFEAASALGTVGLTLGLTPDLSAPCQLVLVFLMYCGRVGGLTLIYAVLAGSAPIASQLPREKVTVG